MTIQAERETLLVMNGYTIGANQKAAFGRIGDSFVMRDIHGNRCAMPVATTEQDCLVSAWALFRANALSGSSDLPQRSMPQIVTDVAPTQQPHRSPPSSASLPAGDEIAGCPATP